MDDVPEEISSTLMRQIKKNSLKRQVLKDHKSGEFGATKAEFEKWQAGIRDEQKRTMERHATYKYSKEMLEMLSSKLDPEG